MKWFGVLLVLVFVGVCLGAEQKPASKPQGTEPVYEGKILSEWIAQTKDKDSDVRKAATKALLDFGPHLKVAIPTLTELLKDKDQLVRYYAAFGLGQVASVPTVIGLLNNQDRMIRRAAAHALGQRDPDEAKAAFLPLKQLLYAKEAEDRAAAADALGHFGPEAKTAIPRLTELLKDEDEGVRGCAALALGNIGPDAKTAIPAITELSKNKGVWVRKFVPGVLGEIGPAAIPSLMELLKDNDEETLGEPLCVLWEPSAPRRKLPSPL